MGSGWDGDGDGDEQHHAQRDSAAGGPLAACLRHVELYIGRHGLVNYFYHCLFTVTVFGIFPPICLHRLHK